MPKSFKQLITGLTRQIQDGDLDAATGAIKHALASYLPGADEQEQGADAAEQPLVAPGQFGRGTFGNSAGNRDYRLYMPSATAPDDNAHVPTPNHVPLIVMLHGCHQNPEDFAAGTRMNELAERHGCCVLYPAQSHRANGSGCWNWFRKGDQHRGAGEPSIIADLVAELCRRYPIDSQRIYAAGLSAGGAFAANLAALYPDLFAAAAVHSGLPFGAAHDMLSGLRVMRQGADPRPISGKPSGRQVPLIVFQGDADDTVNPANAAEVITQALPTGWARTQTERLDSTDYPVTRTQYFDTTGSRQNQPQAELWMVHGGRHGWMGGSPRGSFTEPAGPDASEEILRFFLSYRIAPPPHRVCEGGGECKLT